MKLRPCRSWLLALHVALAACSDDPADDGNPAASAGASASSGAAGSAASGMGGAGQGGAGGSAAGQGGGGSPAAGAGGGPGGSGGSAAGQGGGGSGGSGAGQGGSGHAGSAGSSAGGGSAGAQAGSAGQGGASGGQAGAGGGGAGAAGSSAGSGGAGGGAGLGGKAGSGGSAAGSGGAGGGPGSKTKFGIHITRKSGTTADEIALAKKFCVSYVRLALRLQDWPYKPNEYNEYVQAGFHVLLNLVWESTPAGDPKPFPKDMKAYAQKVTEMLDAISPPEVVVIENEEINASFHSGPIADYVEMLKTASPIVHARKLPMTNGGVYAQGLYALVYRYLEKAHGEQVAGEFGKVAFVPSVLSAVKKGSNAALEAKVAQVQQVLDAAPYLDYINVHHYEVDDPNIADADVASVTTVTPKTLQFIKEFVEQTTGKPILSNETSIRDNTQPALVTDFLQDYADNGFPYVIWWDNIDGNIYGGTPLNEGDPPFALRPNGEAFQSFLQAYNGTCPAPLAGRQSHEPSERSTSRAMTSRSTSLDPS